ncbi:hypothetical protein [Flavisolibacter ginsengisoli]|jgi:hypothetical protein|uniref:Outer membrane protein beta-barrel domain-containing protein n=1 Tax=Flavisolibacter ginsengisoli DSM 18119 TaxID=1121884 RepID=A0A1M4VWR7_9BACT|nr:hypothetical protein [Flavisolibacter ginsengisoli]SHE73172.1 hypothetical protein SAMN02745131_00997 [Flavisolibacter ginsengisoli DSM 18119]
MKKNFTPENFEDFLRQSADGLRMRPSVQVWKGVSSHLNKRRRRFEFIIGAFIIAVSTFGYFIIEQPGSVTTPSPSGTIKSSASQENFAIVNKGIHTTATYSQNTIAASNNKNVSTSHTNTVVSTSPVTNNEMEAQQLGAINPTEFSPTIIDSYFENNSDTQAPETAQDNKPGVKYPLTIESVTNSFKPFKLKKKVGFQFYFTPTVSYRKLGENKSFLRSQPVTNPNYTPALIYDVNTVVTHKPNIGFELGMAAKYPLTRNLKLLGGLQFNVNRYDIKAYTSFTSSVATIMFNGRTNNRPDSLNTYSRYSNSTTGYKSDWLQNYYIQIAAPFGVEMKLSGNDKVQFGVATTVQPTYVLGDRAFMISTDYKSYVEVPQLVRRWNVNTSLETFVGYSTGKLNWQVGPQVRYQLLSSFINKYPVKENLFDFGLKVGVSLNNQ